MICRLQLNPMAQFTLCHPTSFLASQFQTRWPSCDLSFLLNSNQLARVLSFYHSLTTLHCSSHCTSVRLAMCTHWLWKISCNPLPHTMWGTAIVEFLHLLCFTHRSNFCVSTLKCWSHWFEHLDHSPTSARPISKCLVILVLFYLLLASSISQLFS